MHMLYLVSVWLHILAATASDDFSLGPRASLAIARDPTSSEAQLLRRRASLLGRVNVVLALVLVAAGVMLVRGVPW
jgi:copper resistance protein D